MGGQASLNFFLSVVTGIQPRDQTETMHGALMAVTYEAAIKSAAYLAQAETYLDLENAQRMLNKLVRSFTDLTGSLKGHRTVAEQSMTVQNNVLVHGGQTVVGNLTQNSPATPPDKSAVSPAAITNARMVPMEIIGNPEPEVTPATPKLNS